MLRLTFWLGLWTLLAGFAWTTPRTWIVSEVPTFTIMNTHVRDNLDFLGDEHDHAGGAGNGGSLGAANVIAVQVFSAR